MLTTSLNPQDMAQMQGLPIAGYLTKPLTRDKITRVLHEHFDQPTGEPSAGGTPG
ncbi:response regulator [Hymenobacter terrestris]|uniref:Response regulator n=1 Tax=Hymenobacter terrestris TaxID=2748310 RepID=A0ABX2Q847_9BACT|nr:hypothetical protein [Hymenobacter terrestris]NVO86460.1 hypothetical protein [Hymenobacter terrestris]